MSQGQPLSDAIKGEHESAESSCELGQMRKSNEEHSSGGDEDTAPGNTMSVYVDLPRDDAKQLSPSYVNATTGQASPPSFAFSSDPSSFASFGYSNSTIHSFQSTQDQKLQGLRSQSASLVHPSTHIEPSLPGVSMATSFSVEAMRAVASDLKRQEVMWPSEWAQAAPETIQQRRAMKQKGQTTGLDVASASQVSMHNPDFDLDSLFNSQNLTQKLPNGKLDALGGKQQPPYQISQQNQLEQKYYHHTQQSQSQGLGASVRGSQLFSLGRTLPTRPPGTVFSNSSLPKGVLSHNSVLPSTNTHSGCEPQLTFMDPFALIRPRQHDQQSDSSVSTKLKPANIPKTCDPENDLVPTSPTSTNTQPDTKNVVPGALQIDADSKKTPDISSKQTASLRVLASGQRGKSHKAKAPRSTSTARTRATKQKVEAKKAVSLSAKPSNSVLSQQPSEDMSMEGAQMAVEKLMHVQQNLRGELHLQQDNQESRQGEEQLLLQDVDWSKLPLSMDPGAEISDSTQQELEMLLRQDMAMKMQEAPAVCNSTSPPTLVEIVPVEDLFQRTPYRISSTEASTERATFARSMADYGPYTFLASLPTLQSAQQTATSTSPVFQNDTLGVSGQSSVRFPFSIDNDHSVYQSFVPLQSGIEARGNYHFGVQNAADAEFSHLEDKTRLQNDTSPSTAPASMSAAIPLPLNLSATCFVLAQEKRTGELGWIVDQRSSAVEPETRFPIRPLLNGVLAQLHNDWLEKHSSSVAVRMATAVSEATKTGQGGTLGEQGVSSPPPGHFPLVHPSLESEHIRKLWCDLESRRRLFVNDSATLAELHNRAELQLRCEASQRSGRNPMTIDVLLRTTTRPSDPEIAHRVRLIWERARSAATYSVGLLRQAEYCIAQASIGFSPTPDGLKYPVYHPNSRSRPCGPEQQQAESTEKENDSRQEKANGNTKRKRIGSSDNGSQADDIAAAAAAFAEFPYATATGANCAAMSEGNGPRVPHNTNTPLDEAMMRLQARSIQALPQ